MTIDELIARYDEPMARHLRRLVGSEHLAEDLRQELFLRVWRRGPADASEPELRAWLYRVATNLAVDALRRQRVRRWEELPDTLAAPDASSTLDSLAVEAGFGELRPAERFILRLALAGYSLREIGSVLGISSEAARKRVARARARFVAAHRGDGQRPPVVLLLHRGTDPAPFERWLGAAGARVERAEPQSIREQLLVADAVVVAAGGTRDIAPAVYGDEPRRALSSPDPAADRADIALLAEALRSPVPVLAVCRGLQLMNVALGGSLYQDLAERGYRRDHLRGPHPIRTGEGSGLRALLGKRAVVPSDHHQAIRRLGRGLVVTARAPDGAVEAYEHSRRPHTMGVQWQPQRPDSGATRRRIAEAFVDVARTGLAA
jgi:putative glutamine amidotransferase